MTAMFCTKCKVEKTVDDFNKHSKSKTGLQPQCRDCQKAARDVVKEVTAQRSKEYYAANREKILKQVKIYADKNKDKIREVGKLWRSSGEVKTAQRERRRRWRESNRAAVNEACARRKAAKRGATPAWSDKAAMRSFYETAQGLSMLLGEWYHVDHIVPLISDLVCGLHCEANLRVVAAKENLEKGNLWWPDMPEPLPKTKEQTCLTN